MARFLERGRRGRGIGGLLLALAGLVLGACAPYNLPTTETEFVIQAGAFYCDGNFYPELDGDSVSVVGHFEADNVYDLGTDDQWDWNKLVGFYYPPFLTGIHEDSARLVWRYRTDLGLFELGYYCYLNGSREGHYGSLGFAAVGEFYEASVSDSPGAFVFTFGSGPGSRVEVAKSRYESTRYFCKPYFGGTTPCPHRMVIRLRGVAS